MAPYFRAVLFDFGGTLFSYRTLEANTRQLMLRGAVRLGVNADFETVSTAYQSASRSTYQAFIDRSFYLHRELFAETFRLFANELGCEATGEFLDWFHEEQRHLLLEGFTLRPSCIETLETLRQQGLYVGIVSNIDDDYLCPMVERCGITRVLDSWCSSEEAQSCKPDPGIFLYAVERAGCEAQDVLFVGDSPEQDIVGARRVGMTTVLIQDENGTPPGSGVGTPGEPHYLIRSLAEIPAIVVSHIG